MAMTKEEYQELKGNPLFKKFHQYLRDYRQELMNRWALGAVSTPQDQTMAVARCQMADEIVTLDDDSISQFYSNNKGESDVREN